MRDSGEGRERREGREQLLAACASMPGHIGALVFHINNNKNKKTEQGKSYVNGSVRECVCEYVCECVCE